MINFKTTKRTRQFALVKIEGSIDRNSCEYFFQCVEDMVVEGVSIVLVDCKCLGRLSSFDFWLLCQSRRNLSAPTRHVFLINVDSRIASMLTFFRINQQARIYSTREPLPKELLADAGQSMNLNFLRLTDGAQAPISDSTMLDWDRADLLPLNPRITIHQQGIERNRLAWYWRRSTN